MVGLEVCQDLPWHIRASPGDIAETVFAVGDPGRAKRFSGILEDARLVSDYRGLLVYTGMVDGARVTVATHGMGAGSAGIVFEELIRLGAKRIIRLGTSGGMPGKTAKGDIIVADSAGTLPGACGLAQYAPGLVPPLAPDLRLASKTLSILRGSVEHAGSVRVGSVFCSDAFYAEDEDLGRRLARSGFIAVDMETAILYYIARIRGVAAASVLLVTNVIGEHEPPEWDPDEVLLGVFRLLGPRLALD